MADSIGTVNNQSSTQPNGHNSHSNTTESLWRGTDYGKWFVADSCTSLSSSIQGFALPLIAQTVTGSPAQATLLDSIMTMISSVLRLPGGVVQDKYDRKKTYDCVRPDWFRTVRHMRGPRMGGITHIPGADGTCDMPRHTLRPPRNHEQHDATRHRSRSIAAQGVKPQ